MDRVVLNAYFPLGHSPGGFRTWWRRLHDGSDDQLDSTHLMRMAGRFARRVRASAQAHGIPVIDCTRGERKHRIAEEYLDTHVVGVGVFLILVARAVAPVWEVRRSANGVITNLEKKKAFVNHYWFHLMDPAWGHLTVKMSGHPPFGAQVILNGHEYVACQAQAAGIGFGKEGNCFTSSTDPTRLAPRLRRPDPAHRQQQGRAEAPAPSSYRTVAMTFSRIPQRASAATPGGWISRVEFRLGTARAGAGRLRWTTCAGRQAPPR